MSKLFNRRETLFFFALFLGIALAGGATVWATSIGTNLSVSGTLTNTGAATFSSTVGITGLTTMTYASSTSISSSAGSWFATGGGNVGIGTSNPLTTLEVVGTASSTRVIVTSQSATTTVSTGGFTVGTTQLVVQQTSGNVGLGVTNPATVLEVLGTASSTGLRVGGYTTFANLIAGSCNMANATVTASTTGAALCTGATGVNSNSKVFLMATSSLPSNFIITNASSTATDGTIGLMLFNTGVPGTTTTNNISLNYWSFR